MEAFTNTDALLQLWTALSDWAWTKVFVAATLWQFGATVVAAALAYVATNPLNRLVRGLLLHAIEQRRDLSFFARHVAPLTLPALWLVFEGIVSRVPWHKFGEGHVFHGVLGLLTAWIVIRFLASFVRDRVWGRTLSVTIWGLAALNILGLLNPLIDLLDGASFEAGALKVSVLGIVKGAIVIGLFLWVANAVSRIVEKRIGVVVTLTPSAQVLLGKVVRFALYAIAILVGLQSIGIDFTALAVFSGALGLGVGIGLQKVVANLVSGVILLLDKSVKPGDVIAVEGTYGWVNRLTARYVSVITRDAKEYLIPNEMLISQQVENWSYSSSDLRLKLPVGISYDSDPHEAIDLCLKVADANTRVLRDPAPRCLLRGFGDHALDLELRVWIPDPANGVRNVMSDLYLAIWDTFKEHGIGIPYPQRDVHLKTDGPLPVSVSGDDGSGLRS